MKQIQIADDDKQGLSSAAHKVGAAALIKKPYDRHQLLTVIKRTLSRPRESLEPSRLNLPVRSTVRPTTRP